jgi:hypothetical protein
MCQKANSQPQKSACLQSPATIETGDSEQLEELILEVLQFSKAGASC